MNKGIRLLSATLFIILIVSGTWAAEKKNDSQIKTVDRYVAVFDFEVRTGDKDISRSLADSVIHEFSRSGKFEVIDRGNMNKILGEQKFQMSGCVAHECKVEAGQILGVGKIVSGSVGLVGKTYYLTLQLIDVKTGKVELSAEDKCRCEVDELLNSTKRLAEKLLGEKVEEENQQVTAGTLSFISGAKEIDRDGRFVAYADGTVLDTRTNLMWAARDNGKGINRNDARTYCENYRAGGYTDWRMPTQEELAGLYNAGKSRPGACNTNYKIHVATEFIDITCFWVWVSEKNGSEETFFSFSPEYGAGVPRSYAVYAGRALPVRSVK